MRRPLHAHSSLFADLVYQRPIVVIPPCPRRTPIHNEQQRRVASSTSTPRPHRLAHSYSPPQRPFQPTSLLFAPFHHAPSQLRGAYNHLVQVLQRSTLSDSCEAEDLWAAYLFFTAMRREALANEPTTSSIVSTRYALPASILSSLWWTIAETPTPRTLSRLLILRKRESVTDRPANDDDDYGWSMQALTADAPKGKSISVGMGTKAHASLAPLWVHRMVHLRLQEYPQDSPQSLLAWVDHLRGRLGENTRREFLDTLHTSLVNRILVVLIRAGDWDEFRELAGSSTALPPDITSLATRTRFTSLALWLEAAQSPLHSSRWRESGAFLITTQLLSELTQLGALFQEHLLELEHQFDSAALSSQEQDDVASIMRRLRLNIDRSHSAIESWLDAAIKARASQSPILAAVLADSGRLRPGAQAEQTSLKALWEVFTPHVPPKQVIRSVQLRWLIVLARDHACASPALHTLRAALNDTVQQVVSSTLPDLGDAVLCAHLHHATASTRRSTTHALQAARLWLELRSRYVPLRKSLLAGVVLGLQRSVRARRLGLAGKKNVVGEHGMAELRRQRGSSPQRHGAAIPRAVRVRRRGLRKMFRSARSSFLDPRAKHLPKQTRLHLDALRSITLSLLAQSPELQQSAVQRRTLHRLVQLHAELEDYRFTKRLWGIWMQSEAGQHVKQLPLPLYHCRWLFASAVLYAEQPLFANRLYEDFKVGLLPRDPSHASSDPVHASLTPALSVHYLELLEKRALPALASRVLSDLVRSRTLIPQALARQLVATYARKGEAGAEQALAMAVLVQGAWRAAGAANGGVPPPLETYALALDAGSRAFVGWSEDRDARMWALWSAFREALREMLSQRRDGERRIIIATDTVLRAYCAAMRVCVAEPRIEALWDDATAADTGDEEPLATHPRSHAERMAVLNALRSELQGDLGVSLDGDAYGLLVLAHLVPQGRDALPTPTSKVPGPLQAFDRSFDVKAPSVPREVSNPSSQQVSALRHALAWFKECRLATYARRTELRDDAVLRSSSPLEIRAQPVDTDVTLPSPAPDRSSAGSPPHNTRAVRLKSGVAGRLILALSRAGRFEDAHAVYAAWCAREWDAFASHDPQALYAVRNDKGRRKRGAARRDAEQSAVVEGTDSGAGPALDPASSTDAARFGPSGLPRPPLIARSAAVRGSLVQLLARTGEARHAFEELRGLVRQEGYVAKAQWKAELEEVLRAEGADVEGKGVSQREWRSVGIYVGGGKR